MCDRVFVNLPWGSLMRGLILAEDEVLAPLAAVGKPCASYRIILNLRIFSDPIPIEVQSLPEVTVDFVHQHLTAPYDAAGLAITGVRLLPRDEMEALRTTWSRRLSHRQPPPSIEIIATRRA